MAYKIFTASIIGLEAFLVEVEADQGGGEFGKISIVGLPDVSVNESRERVRSAIKNSGHAITKRKITVNLAPAGIKKRGSQYDLPIALAILGLKNQGLFSEKRLFIAGELSLSGKTKGIKSILPLIILAKKEGFSEVYLPPENTKEASLVKGLEIFPVSSLNQIADHVFKGVPIKKEAVEIYLPTLENCKQDFWQKIHGQNQAKRAAEISLAGGHHLLMIGPPGGGKTLIAKTMAKYLPENNEKESLEIAAIKSIHGIPQTNDNFFKGMFRSPHHSLSTLAILGGGTRMRPGEISLSHHGILFLDELSEFSKKTINALRQPMEEEKILISHAEESCFLPCSFILVSATNPCSCGHFGDQEVICTCRPRQLLNYRQKIPSPILDRFDLKIFVNKQEKNTKKNYCPSMTNINRARKAQEKRGFLNGRCPEHYLNQLYTLGSKEDAFFQQATENLACSERAKAKIIKIARTIADLAGEKEISIQHLAEAFSLRSGDTICYN